MGNLLLEINDLETGYGGIQILRGVEIGLGKSESIGLFGPNGHGKTTLLKTISGLLKPWKGSIVFDGVDLGNCSANKIVDYGVIHVPQGNTLFPRMTVEETLMLGSFPRKAWVNRRERVDRVYELFPRLNERKGQLSKTLSGGERQMLSIGVGLMNEVKLLMLDEPTLGLAPKIKEELLESISMVAGTGISLIIVEQDIDFLLSLTRRLYLIEKGRTIMEIDDDQSLDDNRIIESYFGSRHKY